MFINYGIHYEICLSDILKTIFIILALTVLAGCASSVTTQERVAHLSRMVGAPEDTALISVSREGWTAPGITLSVYANGKYFGELGTNKVISWYHPSGELRLTLKDKQVFKITAHVREGRSYHYKFVSRGYFRRFNGGEILDLGSTKIEVIESGKSLTNNIDGFDHKISGGTAVLNGFYVVKEDANINDLQIRRVRGRDHECVSGYRDHIELNGIINEDSAFVIDRMLKNINQCETTDGSVYVTGVYMNSIGGNLKDGYKIGRLFKRHGVRASVSWGQSCESSCAVAFLGAKYRTISGNGSLLFHAPYIGSGSGSSINCADRSTNIGLRRYLNEMLDKEDGFILYDRIMKHCSNTSGWIVNRDAAKIYNVINQ